MLECVPIGHVVGREGLGLHCTLDAVEHSLIRPPGVNNVPFQFWRVRFG